MPRYCPEWRYTLYQEECGKHLLFGESICSDCAKRKAQEYIDDLNFTAAYEARQVDIVDLLVAAAESEDED